MATKIVCDGCGAGIKGDSQRLGVVIQKDYCEACAKRVTQYLEERDALHSDLAKEWQDSLQGLKTAFRAHLAELPDEL